MRHLPAFLPGFLQVAVVIVFLNCFRKLWLGDWSLLFTHSCFRFFVSNTKKKNDKDVLGIPWANRKSEVRVGDFGASTGASTMMLHDQIDRAYFPDLDVFELLPTITMNPQTTLN